MAEKLIKPKKEELVSAAESKNPTVDSHSGLLGAIRGCASWQDIQAKWRTLPQKQKGDLFEDLVQAYLQLDPEYASKLKHVWLQRDVPQAIAA